MEVTTRSSIDISESLASFMLGSHISNNMGEGAVFEKRLKNVYTGKYSIADVYIPGLNTAIEVKSIAHGSSALKGVLQSSIYKEQVQDSVFCMQKPRRKGLRESLESMCSSYGVGLIYIESIPGLCSKDTIKKATGGCPKPFELWKSSRYIRTREKIIQRSRTEVITEYLDEIDRIIQENKADVFNFKIEPKSEVQGLMGIHKNTGFNCLDDV